MKSYDWIAHHARGRPDKVAMCDRHTGRTFTYAQMDERVGRLAAALRADAGVGLGDRIAVLAQNTTDIFEVQFACARLGAVFVPLNWRLTAAELEFIVDDCTPSVLLHDGEFADVAATIAAHAGIGTRVSWGASSPGAADYEELLAAASDLATSPDTSHDTVLTIMYTSGTTGRPKGAVITNGMTFWNAVNQVEFFATGPDMVNLVVLPLFHTGGLNVYANPAFHFGGTNVVLRSFVPEETLEVLGDAAVGITHFLGVPANWLFMSQTAGFADAQFPALVAAGVGGSPTPLALIETWRDKGVALQQAFGMTETSPMVLALNKQDALRKIGSAGMPALHTECRIVDELGDDVQPGAVGELWVRGANITPGYWNRPDANEESFTDGWLHTGDAARQDDEGYFYIVDRWKDMYISGGENVYPAEVENVIYQLTDVVEAAVIGVPDDRWVEVGKAIIVLNPGATLDASGVLRHCATQLAKFKVPKSVHFVDELPHNATGKILKRELRARFAAVPAA